MKTTLARYLFATLAVALVAALASLPCQAVMASEGLAVSTSAEGLRLEARDVPLDQVLEGLGELLGVAEASGADTVGALSSTCGRLSLNDLQHATRLAKNPSVLYLP